MTLVALGFSAPSTAGRRVVDLPVVVTPALEKPVACLPSFSDTQDRAAPCRPGADTTDFVLRLRTAPISIP